MKCSRRINSDTFYRVLKNEENENKRTKNIILPIVFGSEEVIGDFSESHSVERSVQESGCRVEYVEVDKLMRDYSL